MKSGTRRLATLVSSAISSLSDVRKVQIKIGSFLYGIGPLESSWRSVNGKSSLSTTSTLISVAILCFQLIENSPKGRL